jgi:hypothetical protein
LCVALQSLNEVGYKNSIGVVRRWILTREQLVQFVEFVTEDEWQLVQEAVLLDDINRLYQAFDPGRLEILQRHFQLLLPV